MKEGDNRCDSCPINRNSFDKQICDSCPNDANCVVDKKNTSNSIESSPIMVPKGQFWHATAATRETLACRGDRACKWGEDKTVQQSGDRVTRDSAIQ